LDIKTFISSWVSSNDDKGIGLFLEPTAEFYQKQISEIPQKGLSFLFKYLLPYKKYLFQLIIGMVAASIFSLIAPFLTQLLIDVGVADKNLSIIYLIFASQLLLFFGGASIDMIRSWLLLHINTRISLNIISDFLIKLLKLPIKFFDTKAVGDLSQRIEDHHRIESFLTGAFLSSLFSFINIIVFLTVLAYYNLLILLIFVTMSSLGVLWVFLFQNKRKNLDYKRFARNRENQDNLFEMITGMQEIKLFGAETNTRWRWEQLQVRYFKLNIETLTLEQYQQAGYLFITHLKNLCLTFLTVYDVVNGKLSLGSLLSISYIIGQTNGPIEQLVNFIKSAQDARISLSRIQEIHNKDEEEKETFIDSKEFKYDSIDLTNVSFQYEGPRSPYVLKNLNMTIPKGKITAIVGSSGSGKTTLMKLLLNFYTPTAGEITIGGNDLSIVSPNYWRERCGTVMQEGYLFYDTIANNIAMNGKEISEEFMEKAVNIANLKDFIEGLPLRYATKVGASGIGISGGQRQRILIARAVYKNPDYIFFDEATSSLDANNEKIIIDNLNEFFKGKTVIVIAHRLSTVKNADQIIMLEHGEIIEQGTHRSLCDLKGKYYELVKNQLDLE
jgi:ATP-binding cassette subfamily B protein